MEFENKFCFLSFLLRRWKLISRFLGQNIYLGLQTMDRFIQSTPPTYHWSISRSCCIDAFFSERSEETNFVYSSSFINQIVLLYKKKYRPRISSRVFLSSFCVPHEMIGVLCGFLLRICLQCPSFPKKNKTESLNFENE